METYWDKKIGSEQCCGAAIKPDHFCEMTALADYNERLLRVAPLDRPGTDAYFAAVLAAGRREAEALGTHETPTPSRAPKLRLTKVSQGKVFAGQHCDKCGREILPGEKLFARPDMPVVCCTACKPLVLSDVRTMSIAEWHDRPQYRRKKRYTSDDTPVLVPVTAA